MFFNNQLKYITDLWGLCIFFFFNPDIYFGVSINSFTVREIILLANTAGVVEAAAPPCDDLMSVLQTGTKLFI